MFASGLRAGSSITQDVQEHTFLSSDGLKDNHSQHVMTLNLLYAPEVTRL